MPKRKRLSVSVEPGQKEAWEEYVEEENPYDSSISQMIRRLVEAEIGNGGAPSPHESPDARGGDNEEVTSKLDEVHQTMKTIDNRLDTMVGRLNTLEREVRGETPAHDLTNPVFAALPTEEQFNEYRNPETGPMPDFLPEDEGGPVAYSGQPEHIAKLVDGTPTDVERALTKLMNETARVQQTDGGAYYKEV